MHDLLSVVASMVHRAPRKWVLHICIYRAAAAEADFGLIDDKMERFDSAAMDPLYIYC